MITRKEAIKELREIQDSDLFSEYIDAALADIITCLRAEDELGFDIWGVNFPYFDTGLKKLLNGEKLDDEKALKSLYDKYHRSNRWSGKY